jgi:hypothetical protein
MAWTSLTHPPSASPDADAGIPVARSPGVSRATAETLILISARAETDCAELTPESPAAGFLVKSELSAQAISQILGQTP